MCNNPFKPRTPEHEDLPQIERLRQEFGTLYALVEEYCPPGRYKALALTNLEQAGMWAVKSFTHKEEV